MNHYKNNKLQRAKTKRKIQIDDKVNGLPNAGNRVQGIENMDDTLALNERERLTQIYTVRNANEKRVKNHAECDKNTLRSRAFLSNEHQEIHNSLPRT